ncbi:heavy metal translocating P-type ATPase [Radicibacter daui]|uniref:heavy metal translocating P-type ATPase n=1 Tax=Radicibacter daui TaxID=3064829 RepID=UPI004046E73D
MITRQTANIAFLAFCAVALVTGAGAWLNGQPHAADMIWLAGTAPVLAALAVSIIRGFLRAEAGVDVIALLSMAGALALGETLAGSVIGLMVTGGQVLESWAEARAGREMSALLARAPHSANLYRDGHLEQVALKEVSPGNRLLVRTGEVVPVDGHVAGESVVLDESMLTGEPLPVRHIAGDAIRSGSVNAAKPFDMVASATAADSSFAGIVRLVEAAKRSKAPASRLADRYALLFVPLSLALAATAWLISGSPLRALAVLVVATPCPLILAVPVAIVSGISSCARRGVLVKGGGILEKLAEAKTLFFDKTGTLTGGMARLVAIETVPAHPAAEVLRLAASLDQASQHIIADAVVAAARARNIELSPPLRVEEVPGRGLSGMVEGHAVAVGSLAHVSEFLTTGDQHHFRPGRADHDGLATVYVAINGTLAGVLLLADEIRPETPRALRLLRKAGIGRLIMVTGDRRAAAESVGALLGVDAVLAEQTPAGKLAAIKAPDITGPVIMVGDGVNDAPALAAADVGVAMGARGTAASSEAAGIVLLVDRLDRLAEAIAIARRTRRIAVQSVMAGMGLSFAAMLVAALGYLPPLFGAMLQEAIDVVVILNALRAIQGVPLRGGRAGLTTADVERLRLEHAELAPVADQVRSMADQLSTHPAPDLRDQLAELEELLRTRLLVHEQGDETALYPRLADMLGGDDAMAPLSGMHREIHRLCRQLGQMVRGLQVCGPESPDLTKEAQRILYGLDTLLRVHFAEEEAIYHNLEETV